MKRRGSPASLALIAAFVAVMIALPLLLGIPETHGLSWRWGWGTVDRGRTTTRALTPKLDDVRSRSIFLAEGEELVASYDFRLRAGRARVSVYTWGLLPGGRLETFHQDADIREPVRREVRMVAPSSGFYVVSGAIVRATGEFTIEWRVERPRWGGRGGRAVGFALGVLPLLGIALLVLAVLALALRGARRD